MLFEDYLPSNAYVVGVPAGFSYNSLVPYSPRAIMDFDARFKHDYGFGENIPVHALEGSDMIKLLRYAS